MTLCELWHDRPQNVVGAMRKHLTFMVSRGVAPDLPMYSFVLSVCAREASTSAAFTASEILLQMKVQ